MYQYWGNFCKFKRKITRDCLFCWFSVLACALKQCQQFASLVQFIDSRALRFLLNLTWMIFSALSSVESTCSIDTPVSLLLNLMAIDTHSYMRSCLRRRILWMVQVKNHTPYCKNRRYPFSKVVVRSLKIVLESRHSERIWRIQLVTSIHFDFVYHTGIYVDCSYLKFAIFTWAFIVISLTARARCWESMAISSYHSC